MATAATKRDGCHVDEVGDPDVAGLGVIIAALTSIFMTLLTIIILYLRKGLPRTQYNEIDRYVIRFLERSVFPCAQNDESEDESEEEWPQLGEISEKKSAVTAAFLTLLLGFSDQQLLLGFALLLAIYIRLSAPDDFSAYSFRVATTSVWLSCITHLSTILALRGKFPPKGGRAWRLTAATIVLILLTPLLLLSNLPSFIFDPELSFICAWQQISTYDPGITWQFALLAASTVMLTIGGYCRAILAIYRPVRRRCHITSSWKRRALAHLRRKRRSNSPLRGVHMTLSSCLLLQAQLIQGLLESFLWQMAWIVFYLAYGLTGLVTAWTLIPPLEQWSLSFGQVLPLVTLIFLLPPAYDTIQEYVKSQSESEDGSNEDSEGSARRSNSEGLDDNDQERPSCLKVCLMVAGRGNIVVLFAAGFLAFAFQLLTTLFVGGALFSFAADTDLWTGIELVSSLSATAPVSGPIVQRVVVEQALRPVRGIQIRQESARERKRQSDKAMRSGRQQSRRRAEARAHNMMSEGRYGVRDFERRGRNVIVSMPTGFGRPSRPQMRSQRTDM